MHHAGDIRSDSSVNISLKDEISESSSKQPTSWGTSNTNSVGLKWCFPSVLMFSKDCVILLIIRLYNAH